MHMDTLTGFLIFRMVDRNKVNVDLACIMWFPATSWNNYGTPAVETWNDSICIIIYNQPMDFSLSKRRDK
jgi:hypothetical protein